MKNCVKIAILQVIPNLLDFGCFLDEAITHPRFNPRTQNNLVLSKGTQIIQST